MKRSLFLVVAVGLSVTACGTGATGPDGMSRSSWDAYCRHGLELVDTLQAEKNGTLTNRELVSRLSSHESDIEDDAAAASAASTNLGAQLQAVADAVGRAKVAAAAGSLTKAKGADILIAAKDLPDCK